VIAAHAHATGKANDMEPKFFPPKFNALVANTPIDQIKTYLRWHLIHAYAAAPVCQKSFDQENWNF